MVSSWGLLKAAIDRELWVPVNPSKFNQYIQNSDTIVSAIQWHIDDLRWFSDTDWSEISDEEVAKIKNTRRIRENIIKISQILVINRKKLSDRIRSRFPDIIKQSDWQRKLDDILYWLDENELHTIFLHAPKIKSLVKKTFPDFQNDDIERNFETTFFDISSMGSAEDIAKMKRIHREYERHGSIPSKDDISYFLKLYAHTDSKRKIALLSELWATVSIGFALDNNLISPQYFEWFAKTNFGDLYEKLDAEQKKAFKSNLKNKEELNISVSDLEEKNIDTLFQEKLLDTISTSICRDLGINKKELSIPEWWAMGEIKKELESKGIMDWDIHEEFLKYSQKTLIDRKTGKCLIENIENLKNGAVLAFGEGTDTKYIRMTEVIDSSKIQDDVYLEALPVQGGRIVAKQPKWFSYDDFYTFLQRGWAAKVLSADEFQTKLTNISEKAGIDGKLYDASGLENEEVNTRNIKEKINNLDPDGAKYGFEEGTFFVAPAEWEDGKSQDEIWKIHKINGDYIDLMDSDGHINSTNLPISAVYAVLESIGSKFRRIGKIGNDDEFLKGLWEYWVPTEAKIEKGKLIHKEDDGHGHKTEHTLSVFSGKNGHIRIESVNDGLVRFSEAKKAESKDDMLNYAEKQGTKEALKKYYDEPKRMTYQAFLEYLKSNKLDKAEWDYLVSHDHHEHHEHEHSHMKWSFWSRVWKMQNFSSIWKGFEMITHSIEHTLEKWSKLDAARIALSTTKMLHLPDTIEAQLYADIVDGSKEIVEKYQKKIQNLPGPKQRDKCIHIAHNKDARPEEVMAAICFMVSSYGHLYGENNSHYQSVVTKKGLSTKIEGAYSYLDAFIRSTRMPAREGKPAYIHWRLKAYEKARGEAGTEGEPTEEQLLHALFKSIDWNPDDFPYAASVVKAIGWPGGFEKMWKFEGFDGAYKKWKDQTQMVNAQWRLNKAIGYLDTHELYKWLGAMEQVAKKVKSPEYQAFPFIWAVGGFTKYASWQALQNFKQYAETGYTFHAYAFLRKEEHNTTYKEVVRLALTELENNGKIPKGALKEFDGICSRFGYTGEKRDSKDKPALDMMEFWQKYQGKWLHDLLQNNNWWLTKMAKSDNESVKKYRETLLDAHAMQLSNHSVPSGELWSDWYDEHGYESLIVWANEKDPSLKSIKSMLVKIKFDWPNRGWKPMNSEHKKKIWDYVVKYMGKWLRDDSSFLGDEALQKEQFLAHRAEMIQYFAGVLSASEVKDPQDIERNINSPEYEYFNDFKKLGIDPRGIFDYKLAKQNEESDYQNWKKWWGTVYKKEPEDVIASIQSRSYNGLQWGKSRPWKDTDV
jgi:hypothetical protein